MSIEAIPLRLARYVAGLYCCGADMLTAQTLCVVLAVVLVRHVQLATTLSDQHSSK